jgi:hypothetical protein
MGANMRLLEPSDARGSGISVAVLAPAGDEGGPIGHFQASTREVLDATGPVLDAIVNLEVSLSETVTPRRPLSEATRHESDRIHRIEENRGRV